ncbi:thiol-disulfide oxidoreductase LTO1 isoform X1 [Silene latifolia]|uniref:thiol-disulfide oxidoreductase LTO1 isoform X1 n=1 Tax=Silene latifolia TaxID=37657 RepID=UPI003D77074A
MQAMMLASSSFHISTNPKPQISYFPPSIPLNPTCKGNYRKGFMLLPSKCTNGEIQDTDNKSEDVEKLPISSSSSDISSYSWCAWIGGLGFVETSYLTYLKLFNAEPFCPIGGGSCSDVLTSDYAVVLGVPLPLIGMTAYGLILLLGLNLGGWKLPLNINQTDGRLLLLSLSGSMAIASAYFLYILTTRFGGASSCSYCLGSAVLSFSLFFIILKEFGFQELQKYMALPLITAAIVFGVLSTSYSSLSSASPSRSGALEFSYYVTDITTESTPFTISLAKHLHSIGAKMYGAFWCTHCHEQKEMFGREAAKLLDYVECFPDGVKKGTLIAPACIGVPGFPTWVINDEVFSGEKTIEELAKISGFQDDVDSQPN